MIDLDGCVYGENPGFIFTEKHTNNRIPIDRIRLNPTTFVIEGLVDTSDNPIDPEEVDYQKYALEVPGIGYILPGSRVIWKEQDYVLQFGWHRNISNQELYTWYLEPLESKDLTPKTLYRWMINEIEIVHFR